MYSSQRTGLYAAGNITPVHPGQLMMKIEINVDDLQLAESGLSCPNNKC